MVFLDVDLAGYFDDSGTHSESPAAVCAGYVATVRQWKRLERNWRDLDKQHPFIPWHTTDCLARPRQKQFANWDDDTEECVVRALTGYINLRVRRGFIAGVMREDYRDIVPEWLKQRTGNSHYTFCVHSCFGFIRKWRQSNNISDSIHYIFDKMGKGKGEILSAFDGLIQHENEDEIGAYSDGLVFESKNDFIPLQAADLLATGAWRHLTNKILRTKARPTEWWYADLMRMMPKPYNGLFTRNSLKDWVSRMERHRDNPNWGIKYKIKRKRHVDFKRS